MALGKPNVTERLRMPDGSWQEVQLSDQFGLPADPALFAKSGCNTCYGRGTRSFAMLHEREASGFSRMKGPALLRCTCVDKEYRRVTQELLDFAKAQTPTFAERLIGMEAGHRTTPIVFIDEEPSLTVDGTFSIIEREVLDHYSFGKTRPMNVEDIELGCSLALDALTGEVK